MKRLSENQTRVRMAREYRLLMLTYQPDGASYALDNGIGVAKRAAETMTRQCDLFEPKADGLVPNEDGLFPGMSQTWRLVQ